MPAQPRIGCLEKPVQRRTEREVGVEQARERNNKQRRAKVAAVGYRDVTLVVKVAVGVDEIRSLSLALSAADSERLAADLVSVHRLAWTRGKPLDADENEPRPAWL